ncbi:SGNH/GDSL hydrolase family protein [Robertkochia solimangrovi]|nr:SGNH/GDSL hydrolase family protein [Robertkochia solimangrovi]
MYTLTKITTIFYPSYLLGLILISFIFTACGVQNASEKRADKEMNESMPNPDKRTVNYLALGDSYTIGHSVCDTCNFPEQLKRQLLTHNFDEVDLQIIAVTGWTTEDLLNGIEEKAPAGARDLVTLLIGVNNQYQHKDFSKYEEEFVTLFEKAIAFAGNDKDRVVVVSIPDYAYTPFGQALPEPENISEELDRYNTYAKKVATESGVSFVDITDITRKGLNDPELVADDQLHPSEKAYAGFVERLLPVVLSKLRE